MPPPPYRPWPDCSTVPVPGSWSSPATTNAVVTWGYSIESGGRDALLDEIYLDVRGQGIGTRLLHTAMAQARAGGARRMFLETEHDNERARDLYLRNGFELERSIWLSRYL